MKRGQTSIFIIIAVVIVVLIVIYFVVRGNLSNGTMDPDIQPVYDFVNNCVQETAEEGVYYIGQKAGYFFTPEHTTQSNYSDPIPYYYDRGVDRMPSKQEVERQLAIHMEEQLHLCIRNFVYYPDFGVEHDRVNATAEIQEGKVVFSIKYPLDIKRGERTYSLEDFDGEVVVRLNTVYNVAAEIVNLQVESVEEFCLNCIADLASEHDVYVNALEYGEDSVVFTIIDENSKIKGEDYRYIFANRYK
jgi:hypothetical protein